MVVTVYANNKEALHALQPLCSHIQHVVRCGSVLLVDVLPADTRALTTVASASCTGELLVLIFLVLGVVNVHRQNVCAHSKDWRCWARATPARSPVAGCWAHVAYVLRLRQHQSSDSRTLLSQKQKLYMHHPVWYYIVIFIIFV